MTFPEGSSDCDPTYRDAFLCILTLQPGPHTFRLDTESVRTTFAAVLLGFDLLGPSSAQALRAASTEALGRQADRHENLAMLYRRLDVRRGPRPLGDAMP